MEGDVEMKKGSKSRLSIILVLLLALIIPTGCGQATTTTAPEQGSTYPDHNIRLITGQGAGSSEDLAIRVVAPALSQALGQTVVPESMPGSGGRVGRSFVYKSKADGYTLGILGQPSYSLGKLLYDGEYDVTNTTYLYQIIEDYGVVLVKKDGRYKTFQDLLDASKKQQLVISTDAGMGSTQHLQSVLMKQITGIDFRLVPFESDGETLAGLVGDKVDAAMFTGTSNIVGYPDQVVPIVVFADERVKNLPDVPTFKELGFDVPSVTISNGIVAPPDLPADVKQKLVDSLEKVVKDPEVISMAEKAGLAWNVVGPEEYEKKVKEIYADMESTYVPLMKKDMEEAAKK